jgi:diadenosine tetraphosphate (Ap4A) HIT family hydrolase
MIDIEADYLMKVAASTQIVAKKALTDSGATAFNLLIANGEEEAQPSVPHFHWHIVP